MPTWTHGLTGELAALGAAALWAGATIGFARIGRRVPPLELNLLKNLIAIALLLLSLLIGRELLAALDRRGMVLLLVSGAIGIGIGDTAYFGSLRHLGSRRALLVGILAPPMAAVLALIFLAETLTLTAWLGIALAIAGVVWVITERETPRGSDALHPRTGLGVGLGLLAALGQASGAVISHAALTQTSIGLTWSALLRLLAGVALLLLWSALRRRPLRRAFRQLDTARVWAALVGITFGGTYLCILLQQAALRYTRAGIAQTLLSTSPLFVLPIALLLGERITWRAIAGAMLGVIGIALLFGWKLGG